MSFDVYMDSGCSHSSVDDDPDSRDSGVSVSTDAAWTTDFAFTHPQSGAIRKTSLHKSLAQMDEEMEELVLNELIAEFNEHENLTNEQLKLLSSANGNRSSSSRRMFGEITNSFSVPESPKSHFQNDLNRAKVLVQHERVTRRFNRQLSYFDNRGNVMRKRTLGEETTVATKRMNVASAPGQQANTEVECMCARKSLGFSRTMSSSFLERGEYAHVAVAQLPKMLHVISSSTFDVLRNAPLKKPLKPERKTSFVMEENIIKLKAQYSLETVSRPQIDSVAFKSIDGSVLANLLRSMSPKAFSEKYTLIDCRYPYEYNGGHIRGAINISDPSLLEQMFYPNCAEKFKEMRRRIPIFYCEFSQKRGPAMAAALRQFDRKRNEIRYPEVDYKEIYLLDRGYRKFFEDGTYTQLCEPSGYVRMLASPHKEDLKRYQMHRARSFSNFGTGIRMTDMHRRGRLDFSQSTDGRGGGSPRNPRRRDLFGSPFSPASEKDEITTPLCTPKTDPIPMASFS